MPKIKINEKTKTGETFYYSIEGKERSIGLKKAIKLLVDTRDRLKRLPDLKLFIN